jgi:hypothetical protein
VQHPKLRDDPRAIRDANRLRSVMPEGFMNTAGIVMRDA